MSARLHLLPGVCEPGASEWLEGLAAQARVARRSADLPAPALRELIDFECWAETTAALLDADAILADAEVA